MAPSKRKQRARMPSVPTEANLHFPGAKRLNVKHNNTRYFPPQVSSVPSYRGPSTPLSLGAGLQSVLACDERFYNNLTSEERERMIAVDDMDRNSRGVQTHQYVNVTRHDVYASTHYSAMVAKTMAHRLGSADSILTATADGRRNQGNGSRGGARGIVIPEHTTDYLPAAASAAAATGRGIRIGSINTGSASAPPPPSTPSAKAVLASPAYMPPIKTKTQAQAQAQAQTITPSRSSTKKRRAPLPTNGKTADKLSSPNKRKKNGPERKNTSGAVSIKAKYIGVTYSKSRDQWQARVCIQHKQHYCGRYRLAADAAKSYDEELRKLGLDRDPNFDSEEDYQIARMEELQRKKEEMIRNTEGMFSVSEYRKQRALEFERETKKRRHEQKAEAAAAATEPKKEDVGPDGGTVTPIGSAAPSPLSSPIHEAKQGADGAVAAIVSPSPRRAASSADYDAAKMGAAIARQLVPRA